MYEKGGFIEVFAGWISPTRFFFEAVAVGEYRCEPEQSGFTITEEAVRRPRYTSAFNFTGLAGHDLTVTNRSCHGWYWSVAPVILVGITVRYAAFGAMHALFRAQQTKQSLRVVMLKDRKVVFTIIAFVLGFMALFALATWTFMRNVPYTEPQQVIQEQQVLQQYKQQSSQLLPRLS